MSTGILTFHHNTNHGAVAQAHCLAEFLDAPVIDFTDADRREAIERSSMMPAHRACLEWSKTVLRRTPALTSEGEALDFINGLDSVVIGSDEVWKCAPGKGSGLLPGFPNLYYGAGITCKKIAYAASIGHETQLTPAHIAAIDTFDLIGVRDDLTLRAIRRLSPEVAQRVIRVHDPTFAIDFFPKAKTKSGSAWLDQKGHPTIVSEPLNPPEWFARVSGLERARTYRFHGVIACLLGNTPVRVRLRRRRPKVREIMREFGIGWRWPSPETREKKIAELREGHLAFRERIRSL